MTYTQRLRKINGMLRTRFANKLYVGKHSPDGMACVLEMNSQVIGIPWTDDPHANRCIDLRLLNDIEVDNATRAKWMPKVLAAWQGSLDWPQKDLQAAITKLIITLVNEIIGGLPGLRDDLRAACREARNLKQSYAAANAAASVAYANAAAIDAAAVAAVAADAASAASAASAARAAYAAASAANTAYAAEKQKDAQQKVFILACKLWIAAGRSVQK